MAKEFLPLFLDFNETTQDLSDEQCGRLVRALVDYANGIERDIDGMELLAFRFMKGSIDRNEKLSAVRAAAGSKGGKSTQAKGSKDKQKEANESKTKQNAINNNNNSKNNNDIDNLFNRFWAAYPRKVAKPDALKKFKQIDPDEQLLETMLSAIEKWKHSEQWTKDGGQYIPYPSTWLNQRRWEDQLPQQVYVTGQQIGTLPVQRYQQRDYSGEQEEAMLRMINGVTA